MALYIGNSSYLWCVILFSTISNRKYEYFPYAHRTCFFSLIVHPRYFPVHAILKCDKTSIYTTIGRDINVLCSYANKFLFSKKYWCFGESRSTCETLMDTEGFITPRLKKKAIIYQSFRTIHILMTGLQQEDTGIYWAGIDKIYADIMFRITVVVTEGKVFTSMSYIAQLCILKLEKKSYIFFIYYIKKERHMIILHIC